MGQYAWRSFRTWEGRPQAIWGRISVFFFSEMKWKLKQLHTSWAKKAEKGVIHCPCFCLLVIKSVILFLHLRISLILFKEKCGQQWNLNNLKPIPYSLLHSQPSTREVRNANCFLSACLMVTSGHMPCSGQCAIKKWWSPLWGFQESFSFLIKGQWWLVPPSSSLHHPHFLFASNMNVIPSTVVATLWPWIQSMRPSVMEWKDGKVQGLWWHHSARDPTSCLLSSNSMRQINPYWLLSHC